ncbi:MAG: glycosyltransferase family 9 protein [Flavobacterium sp.]|nr:glycosyltransferase family 9 protein [Pedobacter sp.]
MKILIIRFSSIGDIVLTTPIIRCLKQQLKGVEIHYLTKKKFNNILCSNPNIDKLHLFDQNYLTTITQLRAEKFDVIIDLHQNLRTKIIGIGLFVKLYSFDKLNWQKWLLVNFKIRRMPDLHIVDRYFAACKPLGILNDGKGLDYFFNEIYQLTNLLPQSHQQYIGLVIGGQHTTKKLPKEKIIELCIKINKPIVLLGGNEDALEGDEIARNSSSNVFNACGKFSLDQSAYLVKMASQIITHDTGLMHIAAAFNKTIISVWGNTVPEFGMYPYKVTNSVFAEVNNLHCRPCSKIGYKKCPLGHFKCMNEINMSFIGEKSLEFETI